MEQINPYAVVRNTATYDAYRAYMHRAHMAGQPFIFLGTLPVLVLPAVSALMGGYSHHRSPTEWKWVLAIGVVSFAVSLLSFGVGVFRMMKFRREHPIPEEWRQVPRVSWPPVPGRKPPLP